MASTMEILCVHNQLDALYSNNESLCRRRYQVRCGHRVYGLQVHGNKNNKNNKKAPLIILCFFHHRLYKSAPLSEW